MTHLLDRERIKMSFKVVSVSEPFDGKRKREIKFLVSLTLDESEITDEIVGSIYTATLEKEHKK